MKSIPGDWVSDTWIIIYNTNQLQTLLFMLLYLMIVQMNEHQLDILSTQIPEMRSLTVDNLNSKLKEISCN